MNRSHEAHDAPRSRPPAVDGGALAGSRIRPATMDDYAAVRQLLHDSDIWHARHSLATERAPDAPRLSREDMADLVENDHCLLLVAEADGRLAGFLEASLRLAGELDDLSLSWCGVNNLAVREDHRRRGIATALMAGAERWAAAMGVSHVRLTVYEFNAGARRLYDRLGYTTHTRSLIKLLAADGDASHNTGGNS